MKTNKINNLKIIFLFLERITLTIPIILYHLTLFFYENIYHYILY